MNGLLPFAQILELVGYDINISGNALKVYFCLIRHLNETTGQCNPGHRRIAKLTGLSRPLVGRCLKSLEKNGHIKVIKNDKKNNESDSYVILSKVVTKHSQHVEINHSHGGNKMIKRAVTKCYQNDTKSLTIQRNDKSLSCFEDILKKADKKRVTEKVSAQ